MAHSLHVIGGGGGIGRWLIDRVFASTGNIYCYDTNNKALETLAPAVTRCQLRDESGYSHYSEYFQPKDVFLLVVPFTVFEATVTELIPLLKPGSLVVTLSSIQADPINILRKHVPPESTFCGCHPLFGPTVSSPVGQLVAMTNFNDEHPQHQALRAQLEASGLIVTTLDPIEHDRYMSYVQALAHFTLLGFAATLGKDGVHPSDLLKVRTPNFHFLYAFASRVIKLSPTTTGSIQTTPDASRIRTSMLETLTALHAQFESVAKTAESTAECAKIIERLREPLTGAEVDEGAELSTMAAESLQDFEDVLYKYKKNASPFVFRQRTTAQLRVVRITDITHDEIRFKEATNLVERDGKTYFATALSNVAQQNYQSMGLNIRTLIRVMKKRNVKLLDREELDAFYHNAVLPIVIDHNFSNTNGMKAEFFENWLPFVVQGLWRCEFRSSFRQRGEVETITLRLAFNPNISRDDLVGRVRSAVEDRQLTAASTRTPRKRGAG